MKIHYLLWILLISVNLQAASDTETMFLETKPQTKVSKQYDRYKVKGQKVHTAYVYSNRAYYIYTALDISTRIVLPYQIMEEPSNSAADIIGIDYRKGDKHFYIYPKQAGLEGKTYNIHVVCDNGFSVLINNHVTTHKQANQKVIFLDGREMKVEYDKKYFDQLTTKFNAKLQKKDNVLKNLFFYPIKKYLIDDVIKSDEKTFTLVNICWAENHYFFNFDLEGDYYINPQQIVLEIQHYAHLMLFENKQAKQVYEPSGIIRYPNQHKITVYFEIKNPTAMFYSSLKLTKKVCFQNKINFSTETRQQETNI